MQRQYTKELEIIAMGTPVDKGEIMLFCITYLFPYFKQLFKYCITRGTTKTFSYIKITCGLTHYRSLLLVVGWCVIEILIRSSKNQQKNEENYEK